MEERERAYVARIEGLNNTIMDMKRKALEKNTLIDAMKIALAARDKLVAAAINDLTQEKQANLRWEKFAHDAMAQQATLLAELQAAGIGHGKGGE